MGAHLAAGAKSGRYAPLTNKSESMSALGVEHVKTVTRCSLIYTLTSTWLSFRKDHPQRRNKTIDPRCRSRHKYDAVIRPSTPPKRQKQHRRQHREGSEWRLQSPSSDMRRFAPHLPLELLRDTGEPLHAISPVLQLALRSGVTPPFTVIIQTGNKYDATCF